MPKDACYVDLLVQLSADDAFYCDTPYKEYPEGITADSQIVQYSEEGYMSYTFHYEEAESRISIDNDKVCFFKDNYSHFQRFDEETTVKLAVLDGSGNILQVSEPFCLVPKGNLISNMGEVYYDAQTNRAEAKGQLNIWSLLDLSNLGIVVTVIVEVLVGLLFRLEKSGLIAITNLISQVIMRILFAFMYRGLFSSYIVLIIILEILVYCGEGLFYCLRLNYLPRKRVLLFTAAANTASLVIGSVINMILI